MVIYMHMIFINHLLIDEIQIELTEELKMIKLQKKFILW